jgi:hypothetical protein
MKSPLVAALLIVAACADTTPPWDLNHDRVIGVRATPPAIAPSQHAVIDALVAVGAEAREVAPLLVTPGDRAPAVADVLMDGSSWVVKARSVQEVSKVRSELGLAPDQPVPFSLALTFQLGDAQKLATKTVLIGFERPNPSATISVAGAPRTDNVIVALGREVAVETEAGESDSIDWLTSIGELSDDDDPTGYLLIEAAGSGTLVVVRRDGAGGIAWDTAAVEAR